LKSLLNATVCAMIELSLPRYLALLRVSATNKFQHERTVPIAQGLENVPLEAGGTVTK